MNIVFNTNYKQAGAEMWTDYVTPRLAKAGHNVTYNDWDNYEKYDLALFMSPDSKVKEAKRKNPNILVGIADPKASSTWKIKEAWLADFLSVTSLEQRDFFLKYNKNIHIYFHFRYIKEIYKNHIDKEKIIIGYHGNKTHLNCMMHISKALDDLSEKYNIEFWAIYNIKNLGKWRKNLPKKCPVKHIQWSKENYYKYLSQTDIGVIPANIPISLKRGKLMNRFLSSFFKNSLRYDRNDYLIRFKYSTGPGRTYPFTQLYIPVVAEFMPSYCQMIQNEQSGFLVYSKEGWYDALEKLIISPNLRNKMSRNLKNFIDNNYSPDINFKNFLNFINKLENQKK